MVKRKICDLIKQSIEKCAKDGVISEVSKIDIELSVPKQESHGDFSTNVALILASRDKKNPRQLADEILKHIPQNPMIKCTSVAGPGFINFTVDFKYYIEALNEISSAGENFGRINRGNGEKAQVEFVSANPTGPLHIGHGRGAVYGDVLANVLGFAGWNVTKEYYVNDAGNQMRTLGMSVYLRMKELGGEVVDFPKECYQGHYIVDIARELIAAQCPNIMCMSEEQAIAACGDYAGAKILQEIKNDLAETGVYHDVYFHENRLHTDSAVESGILFLRGRGHLYDDGGALWFKSTAFGDDKDRVLKKSDGSLTYFAADIAYHKNKYERGFRRVIDVWGADHAGYVARMKAAVAALGYDPKSFDAPLIQLVNLMRGGQVISMSTRSATYETLEDVRKEVGKDACRYFFLMRSHNAQLDFDLDLAKAQSSDNPVFYIQYAHARISSIFRKAAEAGYKVPSANEVDLSILDLPEEGRLARFMLSLPDVIDECQETLEPHKLSFYLLELARMFQSYYSQGKKDDRYKVISDDKERTLAKLYLLKNLQLVIQNCLKILGISAPEEMARSEEADV